MKRLLIAWVISLAGNPLSANEFNAQIQAYISNEVLNWTSESVLIDAIMAQNETTVGLSNDEILDLDRKWRSEIGSDKRPTITQVISNPAATYLQAKVQQSGGAISELFIMDMRGLNVAASDVTSDYWQGDEGKFENTYIEGVGAVFIDEIEFDESSQTYLAQVSLTLVDPESGLAIGAMTIGLNAESLF